MAPSGTSFFYGTLMSQPVLHRVIFGTTAPDKWQIDGLKIRPAVLHGYCRHKVRRVDYPGILPEEGKTVQGTYVEGLGPQDIRRLDLFEGDEYMRKPVTVELAGPQKATVETYTYVWNDDPGMLETEEWDFEHFVREKLPRWVSDAKEYKDCDGVDPLGNRWWGDGFGGPTEDQAVKPEEVKSAV